MYPITTLTADNLTPHPYVHNPISPNCDDLPTLSAKAKAFSPNSRPITYIDKIATLSARAKPFTPSQKYDTKNIALDKNNDSTRTLLHNNAYYSTHTLKATPSMNEQSTTPCPPNEPATHPLTLPDKDGPTLTPQHTSISIRNTPYSHTVKPLHKDSIENTALPKDSPAYPFSNTPNLLVQNNITDKSSYSIPPASISLDQILCNPLLSNTRPASASTAALFQKALPCPCSLSPLPFNTAGRSAHQANRELRKTLIFDLKHSHNNAAFTSPLPNEMIPRADDLEDLMFSFPGLQDLDFDNPPPAAASDLDLPLWKKLHSRHCSMTPPCTEEKINPDCYFRPLFYMLRHGFQAHLHPDGHLYDIKTHPAAYIHLWFQDQKRCEAAFDKLLKSTDLKPIKDPHLIFPLLPAYRKKHIWRFKKFGTDYLPRLASDISTSGGNSIFSPWRLRYLALLALCRVLSRNDYMATRDITGFFNRLPAGLLLKQMQCFQDPSSYKKTSAENKAAVEKGEATFLQQQSCMFGHRQLPAWASCVSSELARILHKECIRVAGVLIDDFLFHSPAAEGPEALAAQLELTDEIMKKLGVPANDKGQGPSTTVVFSGIKIDSVAGTFSVEEEQREYVMQRLSDILSQDHCSRKDLESINGSLGWLCFVIHHGRCRRDVIQRACTADEDKTPISRPLRKQLRWWLEVLENRAFRPSQIWFRNEIQRSLRIQSDASGEQGFGFCAAGFHVTGCWRKSLADLIEHDMLVKELIPVTIAILLFHKVLPCHIFAPALDNAGGTFRLNCGSCKSPLGRRLLTIIADALWVSDSDIIAGWNSRDLPLAQHADDLSKILTALQWKDIQDSQEPPWIFDLIIQSTSPYKTIHTTIRLPRLAESLPSHLRHRSKAYRKRLSRR